MKRIRMYLFGKIRPALLTALLIMCFAGYSYAQPSQRFTVDFKQASLAEVFNYIKTHSEYVFTYNSEVLNKSSVRITKTFKEADLAGIMDACLENTDFTYEVIDRHVIVRMKEKEKAVRRLIQGKVTSESGEPIPGVSVLLSGTTAGVATDAEGLYQIEIPDKPGTKLIYSFVGMKNKEVEVGSRTRIDVQMEPDVLLLEDVVVQGAYGTAQKRADLVSSVFQVDSKQLEHLPPVRIDKLLDGLVPGVVVEANTDSPDNTRTRYNLRVRGEASLSASNEPLWIVDGTPIYTGEHTNLIPGMSTTISPLSFINPDDLESITILKDASATSIYGANGANGVILVTTKKGQKGRQSLNVSASYGITKINEKTKVKVLNAAQYLELAREAYTNAGKDPALFPWQDNDLNTYSATDTDWSDVYYDLGNMLEARLSFRGGGDKSAYYVSASYFRNKMTIKGNLSQRASFRINDELQLWKGLKGNFTLSASYNVNSLFNPGKDYYENLPVFSAYNADGTFRLYNKYIDGLDTDGNPKWVTSRFLNSVAEREENDNRQRTFVIDPNVLLEYDFKNGLVATAQVGVDYQSSFEDMYDARSNWSGISNGKALGYSTRRHVNFLIWTTILRANYNRTFKKHTIGALAGFEASSKQYNTLSAYGNGFVNDHIKEISYAVSTTGSSSASLSRSMSFFLQGSYSYNQRYYFLFNVRKDGNSSFGKDVRWANFASAGVSWNIHNESFFRSEVVNVLKLKASFGTNGNSRLGSQQAQGTYSFNDSDNYIGEQGASMSASPNPGLSWETTYMTNVGLRVKLFERLDIETEWYDNKTVDLLSQLDVSRTTGDTRVYRNVGKIRNRGIEVTINSVNIRRAFEWRTDFNISHNRNVLLELYNGIEKVMGTSTLWREGYDVNTHYLVRWAGVDPRDGAPLWYDKNGNITRSYSYDDRVPCGSTSPKVSGGLTNTFSYKGFSLRVMMNYRIGGRGFSTFGRGVNSDGLNIMSENQAVEQLDRWQNPGDLALAPKPIWGVSTQSVMNSTRFLYKRTFLKLQNIALSYQLPRKILANTGISNCTFTLVGDNLALWTPYDKKNRNSYRTTMNGYPMETVYSLSVSLSF